MIHLSLWHEVKRTNWDIFIFRLWRWGVLEVSVHKRYYVTPFSNRVHIITWNVGSATPPDDITSLLGLNVGDGNTDMYIIGWVLCGAAVIQFLPRKNRKCPFMSTCLISTLQTMPLMSGQTPFSPYGYDFLPLINPQSHYPLISSSYRSVCCWPLCVVVCHLSSRLQEVNSMINKRLKDVLFTDQWSEVCMERLSPFGYVLVSNGFYYQHICTLP